MRSAWACLPLLPAPVAGAAAELVALEGLAAVDLPAAEEAPAPSTLRIRPNVVCKPNPDPGPEAAGGDAPEPLAAPVADRLPFAVLEFLAATRTVLEE